MSAVVLCEGKNSAKSAAGVTELKESTRMRIS